MPKKMKIVLVGLAFLFAGVFGITGCGQQGQAGMGLETTTTLKSAYNTTTTETSTSTSTTSTSTSTSTSTTSTSTSTTNRVVLSNIRVTTMEYDAVNDRITGLTVRWTTDIPAPGRVEYGNTTSYESGAATDETLATDHAVVLTGISMEYFNYRVVAQGPSGNEWSSGNQSPILTIAPSGEGEDSYIRDLYPDINFSEGGNYTFPSSPWNGEGEIIIGKADTDYPKVDRGFIRFPIPALPSGAQVICSRLSIFINGGITGPFVEIPTMEVHRTLKPWTEGGVTWNRYDGVSSWEASGGDYDSKVEDEKTIVNWWYYYLNITDLTNKWLEGSVPNYGVVLKAKNETAFNGIKFPSFENSSPDWRPKLGIIYILP